jgi:hypothetical protein
VEQERVAGCRVMLRLVLGGSAGRKAIKQQLVMLQVLVACWLAVVGWGVVCCVPTDNCPSIPPHPPSLPPNPSFPQPHSNPSSP